MSAANNIFSYIGWTFLPNVRDPQYGSLPYAMKTSNGNAMLISSFIIACHRLDPVHILWHHHSRRGS